MKRGFEIGLQNKYGTEILRYDVFAGPNGEYEKLNILFMDPTRRFVPAEQHLTSALTSAPCPDVAHITLAHKGLSEKS